MHHGASASAIGRWSFYVAISVFHRLAKRLVPKTFPCSSLQHKEEESRKQPDIFHEVQHGQKDPSVTPQTEKEARVRKDGGRRNTNGI